MGRVNKTSDHMGAPRAVLKRGLARLTRVLSWCVWCFD